MFHYRGVFRVYCYFDIFFCVVEKPDSISIWKNDGEQTANCFQTKAVKMSWRDGRFVVM